MAQQAELIRLLIERNRIIVLKRKRDDEIDLAEDIVIARLLDPPGKGFTTYGDKRPKRDFIIHAIENSHLLFKYLGVTSKEFKYIGRQLLPMYNDNNARNTKWGEYSFVCELYLLFSI